MSRPQPDDSAAGELATLLKGDKEGAAAFDSIAKFYTEQFKYSAGQRISTLQYFVPAFAFLTAGYVQLLTAKESLPIPPLARLMVATVAFVITLAFARLDRRNKQIVEMDEHPLETIQSAIRLRLGGDERWESFLLRTRKSQALTTYGTLIPSVYLVCALAAAAGILYPLTGVGLQNWVVFIVGGELLLLMGFAIYGEFPARRR